MRTRSGYATYTYKQNHGIITDMLTSKWCILLDKAKRIIQYKNQNNVRSAFKSLTQRYRTYFLAQRLCRINFSFYTDTIIAKDKSLAWNTCAQIFPDVFFPNNHHEV